ncbi:hypothetical protein GCM10007420_27200 [Glycocaulis albus]|uniref:Uncharacterized protein n=1 Tax=Glycocaulis albus TaxID=1382801 RepID=A0ABQ1Y178_9PROT|nr:hypothetical protein [Glycocaulis albus]GGH08945.1 hypothetical protein GCM10007420_27200 [Glycocaulis albus]
MMVRFLFAIALALIAAGIVLRVLPPAQPGVALSGMTSLPDPVEPAGRLSLAPRSDETGTYTLLDGPAPAAATETPELVGVTLGREALGHFEYLGETVTVTVDEDIGPWRVHAIDAQSVTVAGPQGMIRLRVYPADADMEGEY